MNAWGKLMRIARGLGSSLITQVNDMLVCDPNSTLDAYNPLCLITGYGVPISDTNPNSPVNPNVAYGADPLSSPAFQQAVITAQQQAAAQLAITDPAGAAASACVNASTLCALGITDANGNLANGAWLWLIGGALVLGFVVMESR